MHDRSFDAAKAKSIGSRSSKVVGMAARRRRTKLMASNCERAVVTRPDILGILRDLRDSPPATVRMLHGLLLDLRPTAMKTGTK